MPKDFVEALRDGFVHITDIHEEQLLHQLRSANIAVDEEGYYVFSFGEHKEYELCIEPVGEEGKYYVALYKNRILLTEKLSVTAA